jgi:hypothetical protein
LWWKNYGIRSKDEFGNYFAFLDDEEGVSPKIRENDLNM